MSELSNRMIRDMQLAGLVEGTRREYLRGVRQLAAYYMVSPDQLSERNVEDYILYVRDDLGVAKGTFARCRGARQLVARLGRLQRLRTVKWAARPPVLAHQLASACQCSPGSSSSTSKRSAPTGLCSPKKSPQATPGAAARRPQ